MKNTINRTTLKIAYEIDFHTLGKKVKIEVIASILSQDANICNTLAVEVT